MVCCCLGIILLFQGIERVDEVDDEVDDEETHDNEVSLQFYMISIEFRSLLNCVDYSYLSPFMIGNNGNRR